MHDEIRPLAGPSRWPSPPMQVDYYAVEPSAGQWLVFATVILSDVERRSAPGLPTMVVGSADSRDDAIGDMVRQLTLAVAPLTAS